MKILLFRIFFFKIDLLIGLPTGCGFLMYSSKASAIYFNFSRKIDKNDIELFFQPFFEHQTVTTIWLMESYTQDDIHNF